MNFFKVPFFKTYFQDESGSHDAPSPAKEKIISQLRAAGFEIETHPRRLVVYRPNRSVYEGDVLDVCPQASDLRTYTTAKGMDTRVVIETAGLDD